MTAVRELEWTDAEVQAQAHRELVSLRKCLKHLDKAARYGRTMTMGECRLMMTANMVLDRRPYEADDAAMVFGAIEAIVDSAGEIPRDAVMFKLHEWAYSALNS